MNKQQLSSRLFIQNKSLLTANASSLNDKIFKQKEQMDVIKAKSFFISR